jgi:hypothetical protein
MRMKTMKMVIPIGVLALGLMAWAGVTVASYAVNPIVNTVRGQITVPSALDGSRVLAGDPVAFLLWDSPVAKIKLSKQGMTTLLGTKDVFNDCRNSGRECSTPSWGPPLKLLDSQGIDMPGDSQCVQSYTSGSKGKHDARVLCIDQPSRILYYYGWDARAR